MVTIRSSKTDHTARGVVRRIHYASNEAVCPVRAVLAWTAFLAGRGITAGPLFTRVDRWGNVSRSAGGRYASRDGRLRPQGIGTIVTALCESAGLARGTRHRIPRRAGAEGTAATASAVAVRRPC
jgi:hypothetical protein